jgi:proteic killer suppression protein
MEVEFADPDLDRLEVDPRFTGGFAQAIVKSFRKKMQILRAVHDERDLYALRGLHFEKLSGARAHQNSIRLNDQWRLILELKGEGQNKKVLVITIEDYH